jgi:hypothetical protein
VAHRLVVAFVAALLVYTPAANAQSQKKIKQSTLRIAENSFYISDLKHILNSDDFFIQTRERFYKRGLNTVGTGSNNAIKLTDKNGLIGFLQKENINVSKKTTLRKICLTISANKIDYKKLLFKAFYSETIEKGFDERRVIYMGDEKRYKHIIYETNIQIENKDVLFASWCIFRK